jgi:hypothetical protein
VNVDERAFVDMSRCTGILIVSNFVLGAMNTLMH